MRIGSGLQLGKSHLHWPWGKSRVVVQEISDCFSGSLMGDDSGRDNWEQSKCLHLNKIVWLLKSFKTNIWTKFKLLVKLILGMCVSDIRILFPNSFMFNVRCAVNVCNLQSSEWNLSCPLKEKFVKTKIYRKADYGMNRSGKCKRINSFHYLKRKILNIWERKSEHEQEIFACNRMRGVTAMSVTVAEIQAGLSIFMVQNYQLNHKCLFFSKPTLKKVSSS